MRRVILLILIILSAIVTGAIAQNKDEAIKLNSDGLQFLECGNYHKACEYFSKAMQLDSTNKFYYNNCAVAHMHLKEYGKAKEMLTIALAIDPYYVKALTNLAIVHFHLLQFAKAYEYYSQALAADSSYTKERFNLEKVIAGVKKVQEEHPHNSNIKEILRQLEIIKKNNQEIPSIQ